MPVIYDDRTIAFANNKKDEIRSVEDLYKFLRDETLLNHFRNNSFDLVKNLRGQHFFAIYSKKKGRVLLIPPNVLRDWYLTFLRQPEGHAQFSIPEAYHDYFSNQFYNNEPLDNDFAQLKAIRRAEHDKNPALRQQALASIPLPYKDVRHIRDSANWLTAYSGRLITKLNNNTFNLNEAEIKGKPKQITVLEPVNKNGTALFMTNTDLAVWYRNLLPRQRETIPEVYRHYFENSCAQDHHLERFIQIQNTRIIGTNNAINPVAINPPAQQGGNPNAFYQPAPIDYQFAIINSTAVTAQANQYNWEVETITHTGDNNKLYRTVKSRDNASVKVEQYDDAIKIRGQLTEQNAKMAASLAGTASPVLSICNDLNDISALVTFFHEALQQGKIPVVRPSTNRNASPITQARVIETMANLIAYNDPNPTIQAKLEANFVALGEHAAAARATYARSITPEPVQLNPNGPRI